MHDDGEQRGPRDGADSPSLPARSPWPVLASLPCVRVGSGLPPSAQTSRSIISFSGEDDLIPVHRRDDHDAVRRDPHRIDLVHPVLRLAERIVRIAGARPMAERRGGREAGLAGMDLAAVFRGQPREVEHFDLERRIGARRFRCAISAKPIGSSTSRPGRCAPSGTSIDDQEARRPGLVVVAGLGRRDRLARGQPVDRQIVVRVGELRARLAGVRALRAWI